MPRYSKDEFPCKINATLSPGEISYIYRDLSQGPQLLPLRSCSHLPVMDVKVNQECGLPRSNSSVVWVISCRSLS
ncbi:hypothetical protein RRG08_049293 [Elysia crispata]|uniref:Uncharacterized protein n=1 Tax=Elysia crispata TaxID=231223 RepID=A0AAE1E7V6_9GAST|nr:hypothetical protein RRG08_049293 [Elysia crispata]